MSYKAVFELFLQIHDFANVDLPCQGIFRLRASIYQLNGTQKIHATPFQFMQTSKKQQTNAKKIEHSQQIEPPYFYSKACIIKYSDDRIIFDDFIRFKLQIQSFPRLHSENVYIQFELLFAEISFMPNKNAQFDGTVVGNKKFKLENLEHGLLNYCQGQFIGNYSSKFAFTIFACLSNFKFGKYMLPSELEAIDKQDENGNIKKQLSNKQNENIRIKQLERSKLKTFDEFMTWINKYYKDKITNSLSYFYNTYVKNLRFYFYNAQQKLHDRSIISQKKQLKVPKQFLQLPNDNKGSQQTEVGQKQFKKYMTYFQPSKLTSNSILQQINIVHSDIYMFLLEVENQFVHDQLMLNKMKAEFYTYVKERYGERVFKSISNNSDINVSNRENKKIAKNMREKQKTMLTVTYPVQDVNFIQAKDMLQFLFYQITLPKIQNQQKDNEIKKQQSKSDKQQKQSKLSKDPLLKKQNLPKQQKIKIQAKQQQKGQQKLENEKQQKREQKIQQQVTNQSDQKQREEQQTKQKAKDEQIKQKDENKNKVILNQTKKLQQQPSEQNDICNKKQESDDDNSQNVYSKVSHQKGEIDSQMTEKSFENQQGYGQQEQCIFQGISQIKLKQQPLPHFMPSDLHLPKLNAEAKDMLIVLCHGFQGSSYDMAIILRRVKEMLPQAFYLIAKSNEGNTEGDIQQMGERLAKEIENYIRNYMDRDKVVINFIGHSMGGIIARTGAKYLNKRYSERFGFFCSLSSPHLGYLNGVDGMIKAGLWAILKFKPIKSLQQLKMEDSKDLRKSFLYRLSHEGSLKRFRKIILFSSFEDSYVSWHSARISPHNKKKSSMTKIQQQMVSNILGNAPIHRIDVNFNVKTNNLDSFIGRTAHINLIVQQSLFKIIESTIPDLFSIRQL